MQTPHYASIADGFEQNSLDTSFLKHVGPAAFFPSRFGYLELEKSSCSQSGPVQHLQEGASLSLLANYESMTQYFVDLPVPGRCICDEGPVAFFLGRFCHLSAEKSSCRHCKACAACAGRGR